MTEPANDDLESILEDAVRQFVDAGSEGVPPNVDEFVKQYPGCEQQVRQRIDKLHRIDALLDSLVQTDADDVEIGEAESGLLGHKLAEFEIIRTVGRGGMGVVYLARDTKLERFVAIKSMPPGLLNETASRARFRREAKVLASLSHPNIAVIYDMLEQNEDAMYLVLEYVPGETLAERIARNPLKLKEALLIAQQVAEALSAAYERGVIHRDLKPSNIKITPDGRVKVLDFGLAKTTSLGATDCQSTITQPGRVAGTPAYMSPEQARGQEVDHRSDTWAFGCVLYEMLTGRVPFPGDTVSDTLAGILDREPDWQALPETTPANIRVLLRRCLEKDSHKRLQHLGDAHIEISDALTGVPSSQALLEAATDLGEPSRWRRRLPWLLTAMTTATVIILSAFLAKNRFSRHATPDLVGGPVWRSEVSLPSPQHFMTDDWATNVALSPDGTLLAYVGGGAGQRQLCVRNMIEEFRSRAIDGTEGARSPCFSADGQSIAFFAQGKLMRVSLKTWTVSTICTVEETSRGGTWASDDTIFFNMHPGSGLYKVSAHGGDWESVTRPDSGQGERCHCFPCVLPDNRHILFTIASNENPANWRIAVLSLDSGKYRVLNLRGSNAYYVRPGYLVYAGAAGRLMAVSLDVDQLEIIGSATIVVEDALTYPVAQFCVCKSGTLAYAPGGTAAGRNNTLVWVTPSGHEESIGLPAQPYASVRLSPDGSQLVTHIGGSASDSDIYVGDLSRLVLTRLTFLPAYDVRPRWTPISKRITYSSERNHPPQLHWIFPDGTGDERLWDSEPNSLEMPGSWSSDERYLAFAKSTVQTQWDIWVLSMEGGRQAHEFLGELYNEKKPAFRPDGRWIAYVSDETGRYEVYVRRFPGGRDKTRVSTDGGDDPMWHPSGGSLYYRNGNAMMAVAMETEPSSPGQPQELFRGQYESNPWDTSYDVAVTADGLRFLMIKLPPVTHLNVVMNWAQELRRLMSKR